MIECPHIPVFEIAEAWRVSTRTVQRWFSDYGIFPVMRGRYRRSDVEMYARVKGKPELSKAEKYELSLLKEENEALKSELAAVNARLQEIARLSVGGGK